ncbi:MAG: hypothetical protein KDD47_07780 [Acidobacteria bacterium]|nr:hypothetical protein [Acidobacteriota bacterium]
MASIQGAPPQGRRPSTWKRRLADTRLFDFYRRLRAPWELRLWKQGRLAYPPPLFKQRLVGELGRRFRIPTLIETGTFFGDMLWAHRRSFRRLVSVELDPWLFERALRRFAREPGIEILHGDSAEALPDLVRRLDGPCLFWLDAHAMIGGVRGPRTTPIREELAAILAADLPGSVILIDDVRLFTGAGDYPPLDEVRARLSEGLPRFRIEVREDVLCCYDPVSEDTKRHS